MTKLQKQENQINGLLLDIDFLKSKCPNADIKYSNTKNTLNYWFITNKIVSKPEFVDLEPSNWNVSISFYNSLDKEDGSNIKIYNITKNANICSIGVYNNSVYIDYKKLEKLLNKNLMVDNFEPIVLKLLNKLQNRFGKLNIFDNEGKYSGLIKRFMLLQ